MDDQRVDAVRRFYDRFWAEQTREHAAEEIVRRSRGRIYAEAYRALEEAAPAATLVVGPGTSDELGRVPGRRIIAADLSSESLRRLQPDGNAKRERLLVQADTHTLPLASESVDAAFVSLVLMHLRPAHALAEIRRVLRPGGRLVAVEPLAHHPVAVVYRCFVSEFRETNPSFLPLGTLRSLAREWQSTKITTHHLLVPFALPAVQLSAAVGRPLLAAADAIDRSVLERLRFLDQFAWMALCVFDKARNS